MAFIDDIQKGVMDAANPRNIVMVLVLLIGIGFFISSDLPGASQARDVLPFG